MSSIDISKIALYSESKWVTITWQSLCIQIFETDLRTTREYGYILLKSLPLKNVYSLMSIAYPKCSSQPTVLPSRNRQPS